MPLNDGGYNTDDLIVSRSYHAPHFIAYRARIREPLPSRTLALLPNVLSYRLLTSVPDRIRTCDLLLRRQSLYPAELRGQTTVIQCFM